jgi:serine/threonine-protein kinase HipA
MSSADRLIVCLQNQPVGHLDRDETSRLSFTYEKDAKTPISLSMPLDGTTYGDVVCEAFFGGLLPENQQARELIARRLNANANNTFSLLKAIGKECAGAISLHDPTEPLPSNDLQKMEGEELAEKRLAELIRDLPRTPLLAGVQGIRLSLAGFQNKAGVCLIDGRIYLPAKDVPTTHILKPAMAQHEATVQNEFLCLSIASGLGLPTAKAEIRRAEDQAYVLVERYDREIIDGTFIRRIHQEDFCQAIGIVAAHKYEAENGPGFKECFELLKQSDRPALDRTTFAKFLILNYLLGNADAHGKNFSLLHPTGTSTKIAPLYDVLSIIHVYDDLIQNIAMSIGGCFNAADVTVEDWKKLCKNSGFGFPAFRNLLKEQVSSVEGVAERERDKLANSEFQTWVADMMILELGRSCDRVRNQFGWT